MTHQSMNALCVGGPLDGKMLQHNSPYYRMRLKPADPIPASRVNYGTGVIGEDEYFIYVLYGLDGHWLWAREGQTLGEVLGQLLEAYWQYRDLAE